MLALVADLHLGARPCARDESACESFASFVSALPDLGVDHLLLLGDTLELLEGRSGPPATAGEAVDRCRAVLEGARVAMLALTRAADTGCRVSMLVGNHDADLARPEVRALLLQRLNPMRSRPVEVVDWFVLLAGRLYAEHGHQHHDINRVPRVLDPDDPRRPGDLLRPLGAVANARPTAAWAAAGRCARTDCTPLDPLYLGRLEQYGRACGLDLPVVAALDRLSATDRRHTAARLIRRGWHRAPPDAYLVDAATRVDALLAAAGAQVPVLAFGHTHQARDVRLPTGGRYLNPGAWATASPGAFHYALIGRDANGADTGLRTWRPVRG